MKQPASYKSFQTANAERLQDTKEIIKLIVSLFNIKVIRNVELSFRRNRQQTGIFLRQINQCENTRVVVRNYLDKSNRIPYGVLQAPKELISIQSDSVDFSVERSHSV